jgi:hypothetical protein
VVKTDSIASKVIRDKQAFCPSHVEQAVAQLVEAPHYKPEGSIPVYAIGIFR